MTWERDAMMDTKEQELISETATCHGRIETEGRMEDEDQRKITATKWSLGDFSRVRAYSLPPGEGHAHRKSI